MRIMMIVGIIGIIMVLGIGAAAQLSGYGRQTNNVTLNITCSEGQKLFTCDCNSNVEISYDIVSNKTVGRDTFINYTGQLNVAGRCIQGKRETELNYTGSPHDEIVNDIFVWLRDEYQANKVPKPSTKSQGGGNIKVRGG